MNFIKITTPEGKVFVVPEPHNRAYYEQLNLSVKEPEKRYKIEAATGKEAAGSGFAKSSRSDAQDKIKELQQELAAEKAAHAETLKAKQKLQEELAAAKKESAKKAEK
jgi:hypothetical protein